MIELKTYIEKINAISADSWQCLQRIFTEQTIPDGEFFLKEGQMASRIGFLKNGIIRAFYRNNNGFEYNKHFFISPCFFGGYASLITGKTNYINQQALTDCSVFVADYKTFTKLFDQHHDIERAARKLAELFFVAKENREIEIVTLDADERYLLFQEQYPGLEQKISQYHIASYLGITPTQLSRIRKKLTAK